jgi:ATPase subunit of ABC transporter with duplicated ATPase domains
MLTSCLVLSRVIAVCSYSPQGAGKSTLLKLLTHKLTATTGTVEHHPNYVLAYFGQHSTAELDMESTALEWMQTQFPGEPAGALRNHLAKTGIVGGVGETRMKGLSYSQRSCIIFAKLTYVCPHLLILDEPTNFLDLESVDSLISACNKYKGALLLVSHNRDFLRKCARQYLSVVPGAFQLFNNMKQAEQATYTFIQVSQDAMQCNAMQCHDSCSTEAMLCCVVAARQPNQRYGHLMLTPCVTHACFIPLHRRWRRARARAR